MNKLKISPLCCRR